MNKKNIRTFFLKNKVNFFTLMIILFIPFSGFLLDKYFGIYVSEPIKKPTCDEIAYGLVRNQNISIGDAYVLINYAKGRGAGEFCTQEDELTRINNFDGFIESEHVRLEDEINELKEYQETISEIEEDTLEIISDSWIANQKSLESENDIKQFAFLFLEVFLGYLVGIFLSPEKIRQRLNSQK